MCRKNTDYRKREIQYVHYMRLWPQGKNTQLKFFVKGYDEGSAQQMEQHWLGLPVYIMCIFMRMTARRRLIAIRGKQRWAIF